MTGISDGEVDLFGLPVLPEKGRGRPAHVWTRENSDLISLLFACGRSPTEVAHVLGITKPTFYKHYFNEISRAGLAPLMMRGRQLVRLNKLAEAGNVAAEKALAGLIQSEQIRTAADRVSDRGKGKAKPAAEAGRIGKKEQAKQDAQAMGGRFGARQPPPLLIQ